MAYGSWVLQAAAAAAAVMAAVPPIQYWRRWATVQYAPTNVARPSLLRMADAILQRYPDDGAAPSSPPLLRQPASTNAASKMLRVSIS